MGYFDVEDILADATPISVTFAQPQPHAGFLVGQPAETVIKPTEAVQLPYWLVELLAMECVPGSEDEPLVNIRVPEYISQAAIKFYAASPTFASLQQTTGFYACALRWCSVMDDARLVDVVSQMLVLRSTKIWDLAQAGAQAALSAENVNFEAGLDIWERHLWKLIAQSKRESKKSKLKD